MLWKAPPYFVWTFQQITFTVKENKRTGHSELIMDPFFLVKNKILGHSMQSFPLYKSCEDFQNLFAQGVKDSIFLSSSSRLRDICSQTLLSWLKQVIREASSSLFMHARLLLGLLEF